MQSHQTNLTLNTSYAVNTSKVYFWLLIVYFCLPNYEFSALSAAASGLKSSDFVSIIIAFFLYKHGSFKVNKILLFFALWYFFKGILSLSPISFLFGARFLEYIVVIAAAYNMNTKDLEKFFSIFTNFLIFYFFLEAIFILLGLGSPFSFLNSGMTWQGRFTSIFGGPYELGAIALLLTFLPGNQRKVFFIILLFFSQARASILGLGALIFNPRAWILILPLSIIMIFVAVSRFDDLFNLLPQISSIFETFTYLLNDFSYTSKEGYINNWNMREDVISLISEDGGRSTLLRIYTYLLILSGMSDISVIIFGYFPGIYGVAVDSSLLRIFGETGLIGIILFLACMTKQIRKKETFLVTVAFFINLSLVDIYFSSKAFTLYWIIVFYLTEKKYDFQK